MTDKLQRRVDEETVESIENRNRHVVPDVMEPVEQVRGFVRQRMHSYRQGQPQPTPPAPAKRREAVRDLPAAGESQGFIPHDGGWEPHYRNKHGGIAREPRAVRRAREQARFERYRYDVRGMWLDDPKLAGQVMLLCIGTYLLAWMLVYWVLRAFQFESGAATKYGFFGVSGAVLLIIIVRLIQRSLSKGMM